MSHRQFESALLLLGVSARWVRGSKYTQSPGFWMLRQAGWDVGSYCPRQHSARIDKRVVRVANDRAALSAYAELLSVCGRAA